MPVVAGALMATSSISSAAWDGERPGVLIVRSPVRCLRQQCSPPRAAGVGGWGAEKQRGGRPHRQPQQGLGKKRMFSFTIYVSIVLNCKSHQTAKIFIF